MKLLINLFIILYSVVNLYPQNCKTGLIIKSDIQNLRIFINDSLEYKDQFEFELNKGFYTIIIQEDSDRWDAKTEIDSFYLDSCEIKTLLFSSDDEILIDSNPQDAKVFIGDTLIGYTPLQISKDFNQIILKKEGYSDKEILLDERMSRISASLEFIGQFEREKFFDRSISKILFGSMIILGATAAYFKVKADNNYDEYLRSGNLNYKDRTKDFDLISGVALGLTQINFGFLIYKIFSDN